MLQILPHLDRRHILKSAFTLLQNTFFYIKLSLFFVTNIYNNAGSHKPLYSQNIAFPKISPTISQPH